MRNEAFPAAEAPSSGMLEALDGLVRAGVPGAAAMVVRENGIRAGARGLADLRTHEPMLPGLHFRAGSLTKTFVAAEVLHLAADGRLALADPVARHLPGMLPAADRVTLRQLLNHTGGVPDNTAAWYEPLFASANARFRPWQPSELVGLVAGRSLTFEPGTAWAYSNTGYTLLGLVIESVTGIALADALARDILRPLALVDSFLPVESVEVPAPAAHGYIWPRRSAEELADGPLIDFTVQDPSYAWAAGGMISNLSDLAAFMRALLGDRFLPPTLRAEMLTMVDVPPDAIPLPFFDRYGLGVIEFPSPIGRLVGNAGGIPGYLSMALSTRDGGGQLGLMINAGDLVPDGVVSAFSIALAELSTEL